MHTCSEPVPSTKPKFLNVPCVWKNRAPATLIFKLEGARESAYL